MKIDENLLPSHRKQTQFNVFNAVATYVIRSKGWSVLLAAALGLEGYRFHTPHVERWLKNLPAHLFKYEDLLPGAEHRALETRNAWFARYFADLSEALSKMVLTAADMTFLLRTVEDDLSLVHAAYYTDNECIARIADWIAGIRLPDGFHLNERPLASPAHGLGDEFRAVVGPGSTATRQQIQLLIL